MNRTIQSLFSVATLLLILLYGHLSSPTGLSWVCLAGITTVYLALIWIPLAWWTPGKYVGATVLLFTFTGYLHLTGHSGTALPDGVLLIPFVLLLAREQQAGRNMATALAILTMIVMCLLTPALTFISEVMPVVIALYVSVRAINIYKQAYILSQQNMAELSAAHQELRQAHADLQAAALNSMRYAALAERTRLARDIHDGLGHQLTSLIVQLQALEIMLPGDPERAARAIPEMLAVARKAMTEVHQVVKTWREDESREGASALRNLVSEYATLLPIDMEFQQDEEFSDWPVELSVSLYRFLQEALTNILRHAGATAVSVRLQEHEGEVILTVIDDGRYSENVPLTPGYGIQGMQERARALGGSLQMSQNLPRGLKLQVKIPLRSPQPERVERML